MPLQTIRTHLLKSSFESVKNASRDIKILSTTGRIEHKLSVKDESDQVTVKNTKVAHGYREAIDEIISQKTGYVNPNSSANEVKKV